VRDTGPEPFQVERGWGQSMRGTRAEDVGPWPETDRSTRERKDGSAVWCHVVRECNERDACAAMIC
jgi:hypothetical protein